MPRGHGESRNFKASSSVWKAGDAGYDFDVPTIFWLCHSFLIRLSSFKLAVILNTPWMQCTCVDNEKSLTVLTAECTSTVPARPVICQGVSPTSHPLSFIKGLHQSSLMASSTVVVLYMNSSRPGRGPRLDSRGAPTTSFPLRTSHWARTANE